MSKELFIAAHEELIEEFLDTWPDKTEAEAYAAISDEAIYERYIDNVSAMIDHAHDQQKDRELLT